jgi:hypothetical protein
MSKMTPLGGRHKAPLLPFLLGNIFLVPRREERSR